MQSKTKYYMTPTSVKVFNKKASSARVEAYLAVK